jgi:hypothetical protein
MIRPVNFGFNPETAVNNAFQKTGGTEDVQEKAKKEFDDFVELLRKSGVDVTVVEDEPLPYTPDAVFPNNWVSFHHDGTVLLYPMFAMNRRLERKPHVLESLSRRFTIGKTIDLSVYEKEGQFLEGTGSMVLDRDHHIAYACRSPRTSQQVLTDFCRQMGYTAVLFNAVDGNGLPVYHTNVMMCVADAYVVICIDAIPSPAESKQVADIILGSGKAIITISLEQMNAFAGNMLQVQNNREEKLLIMSSQAFHSLTQEQLQKLRAYNKIIHSPLETIEGNGGGSARCMMAEVHLPPK